MGETDHLSSAPEFATCLSRSGNAALLFALAGGHGDGMMRLARIEVVAGM
jgi:hypothetical protein